MDAFFRTHNYLVDHLNYPIERLLMKEIDWSQRLIGIKGSRGVGKTSFLLAYARRFHPNADRSCLYINLNNFYFTDYSLVDFADEFSKRGGKVLLIDQINKYHGWSHDLREIYDTIPELKIVFTGSSIIRLKDENPDLDGLADSYNLRGFSFREFLNHETDSNFKAFSFEEIMENHREIASSIIAKVRPLAYFQDYVHHGYYPFYLEKNNYSEALLKMINLILEIDITNLRQIELKYLPKLRKLLYLLSLKVPSPLNVSKLSDQIQMSRATVMNYIKYLKDARLFNFLYAEGESFPKKPSKVYFGNTNLVFALDRNFSNQQALCETFFYNMMHKDNRLNSTSGKGTFRVNGKYSFDVKSDIKKVKSSKNLHYAVDMVEKGSENTIPLWLFGFLY